MTLLATDGYGSHIPTIETTYPLIGHSNALEFGCGLCSTPWLLDHYEHITSVETNLDWIDKTEKALTPEQKSKWTPLVMEHERDFFYKYLRFFDLILVDGYDIGLRRGLAQICLSMEMSSAIVIHDSERPGFHYDEMMIPPGWIMIRVEYGIPWTSVFSNNALIAKALLEKFHCTVCDTTNGLRKIPYSYK